MIFESKTAEEFAGCGIGLMGLATVVVAVGLALWLVKWW